MTSNPATTAPNAQDKLDEAALRTLQAAARLFRLRKDATRDDVIAELAERTGTGTATIEAMIDRAQMIQAEQVN